MSPWWSAKSVVALGLVVLARAEEQDVGGLRTNGTGAQRLVVPAAHVVAQLVRAQARAGGKQVAVAGVARRGGVGRVRHGTAPGCGGRSNPRTQDRRPPRDRDGRRRAPRYA